MFQPGTVYDVTEFVNRYNQMVEQIKDQRLLIEMLKAQIKVLSLKCEYFAEISRYQR